MTVRDLTGPGVPESTWQSQGIPAQLPVVPLEAVVPAGARAVVLAPHPNDEVLGCGGLLARLAASDVDIVVIAVTDGEASHPGRADWLRRERARERSEALAALGIARPTVQRLGLPDAAVRAEEVAAAAINLVGPDDTVFSPWRHDGHPDHDAVGEAAAALPGRHWSYLVWAWHWATRADVPWQHASRIPLSEGAWAAKRRAVGRFGSQLSGPSPILPSPVLRRLLRRDEVLLAQVGATDLAGTSGAVG